MWCIIGLHSEIIIDSILMLYNHYYDTVYKVVDIVVYCVMFDSIQYPYCK